MLVCSRCGDRKAMYCMRCCAEIAAAHKAEESPVTDTQQLKAEIAAIADSVEDYTTTGADAVTVACIVRDLRQLSAV